MHGRHFQWVQLPLWLLRPNRQRDGISEDHHYTLAEEGGASLRASGWSCAPGFRGGGSWNVPGRPRAESRNTGPKRMYYKELR